MAPNLKTTEETKEIDKMFGDELRIEKSRKPLTFDSDLKESIEEVREVTENEDAATNQE